ncbi:NUDIX hydrolase [Deinococcus sp.]|uniref:NUDIX hydrolase n=1 Tax=Deinococcus sp. TaxID=47478 RepID=UPI003C7A0ADB
MKPDARISSRVVWQGEEVVHAWESGTALPAGLPIRQVSGVCWTDEGQVVLVSEDGLAWNLPGGHPEGNETPQQTLAREVLEEACAEVLTCHLLGWQRVQDPRELPYLQLRYVARIRLLDFRPEYETLHRRMVLPQEFLNVLSWGHSPIAAELLRVALETNLP